MSPHDYIRLHDAGTQGDRSELKYQQTHGFKRKSGFWAWTGTIWPLVLHWVLAVAIVALMRHYVDGRDFNPTKRRPEATLANGLTTQSNYYAPLQSDVITFLTGTVVVLRLITTAWTSSLYWRGAFYLMEGPGLRWEELDWMVSFGFFSPTSYLRDSRIVLVSITVLIAFSASSASPLLLGAISWVSSTQLAELQSYPAVATLDVVGYSISWDEYMTQSASRERAIRRAVGGASLTWGREIEKNLMKRVIPSATVLHVGTTITNVTLPYFSVNSFEWIPDPLNTLPPDQRNITDIEIKLQSVYGAANPLQPSIAALIPDEPWHPTAFPSPSSVIDQTRTLVMNTHQGATCTRGHSPTFPRLPPSLDFLQFGGHCYAFARVTYSAGVTVCKRCRLSGQAVAQNDTILPLHRNVMTAEALRLMADVSVVMVQQNSSIPSTNNDITDYAIGMLKRSYTGAWCALGQTLANHSAPSTSTYYPAFETSKAKVDIGRIYGWLFIQLLVTLSGAIFLLILSASEYRLIGDTTLAALKLDATETTTDDGREQLKAGGLLKLKPKDGRLKVVVELETRKSA